MKTLIINNGSKHLLSLQKFFAKSQETITWSEISTTNILFFDLIVLSGSSYLSVLKDFNKLYKTEVELILNSQKPLIGICFGCELIAYSYGSKLKRLHNKQKGIIKIKPSKSSDIFQGLGDDLSVYEAHRWSIISLSDELEEVAHSSSGTEILKHKKRPIYGIQFHPEEFCDQLSGGEILNNIIKQLQISVNK